MTKDQLTEYMAQKYADSYNEDNPQLPLKRAWRFYVWEAVIAVEGMWPMYEALIAIEPHIPNTSAAEGGAAKYSTHVKAADKVRAALEEYR